MTSQDALIGVSFGSDHHEIGFWNFNDFNKTAKNPEIYFYSSYNAATECSVSYLKDLGKSEYIFNIKNSFAERKHYEYLNINSPVYNTLSYFSDSINKNQYLQREKWLSNSKNIYDNISRTFLYTNSAHKIVCLPNFSPRELRSRLIPAKDTQNIILTAGNDMNLRYWNLSSEKFYHISNVDGKKRMYNTNNTGVLVYQETHSNDNDKAGFSNYQNKNGYSLNPMNNSDKVLLAQAGHRGPINDIIVVEKNEMVITCSKDKTIKVWK